MLFLVVTEVGRLHGVSAKVLRAYGSINHSAGRREAMRGAAELYFHERGELILPKETFRQLMHAWEKGSNRRDDIAHGKVVSLLPWKTAERELKGGHFLFASGYNTGRNHAYREDFTDPVLTLAKYRYVASDIIAYGAKFHELRAAAMDLSGALMGFDLAKQGAFQPRPQGAPQG